jgi:hypothetical protein
LVPIGSKEGKGSRTIVYAVGAMGRFEEWDPLGECRSWPTAGRSPTSSVAVGCWMRRRLRAMTAMAATKPIRLSWHFA